MSDAIVRVACDQSDDRSVDWLFERIVTEQGRLDLLVNNAWGGYENMVEDGRFTWSAPFWAQPLWRWAAMMDVGVRAAFVASQHAARLMLPSYPYTRASCGRKQCLRPGSSTSATRRAPSS